jgi:hypothetical protein
MKPALIGKTLWTTWNAPKRTLRGPPKSSSVGFSVEVSGFRETGLVLSCVFGTIRPSLHVAANSADYITSRALLAICGPVTHQGTPENVRQLVAYL